MEFLQATSTTLPVSLCSCLLLSCLFPWPLDASKPCHFGNKTQWFSFNLRATFTARCSFYSIVLSTSSSHLCCKDSNIWECVAWSSCLWNTVTATEHCHTVRVRQGHTLFTLWDKSQAQKRKGHESNCLLRGRNITLIPEELCLNLLPVSSLVCLPSCTPRVSEAYVSQDCISGLKLDSSSLPLME